MFTVNNHKGGGPVISRFLKSKLFFLLSIIFFVSFTIGYDYAVISSGVPSPASAKAPVVIPYENDSSVEIEDSAADGGN